MHMLVKKRVFPDIGLLQAIMTGKWMLPPRVSTTREKRTPKRMVVDGVVPRDIRRTTLHNRANLRGITRVRNGTSSGVAPR